MRCFILSLHLDLWSSVHPQLMHNNGLVFCLFLLIFILTSQDFISTLSSMCLHWKMEAEDELDICSRNVIICLPKCKRIAEKHSDISYHAEELCSVWPDTPI